MDETDSVFLVLIISMIGMMLAIGSLSLGIVAFVATLGMIVLMNLMVLGTHVLTQTEIQGLEAPEENEVEDSVEILRRKYVNGDITDEEFENMVSKLLETSQKTGEEDMLDEIELSEVE